jgi:hypothetical protein
VDESVTALLGADPVAGLTLHIYATEAEYTRANPMAGFHPGILAHVNPESKEMGVAVERLRQAAPELARESFRHEMTHVVLGELSNQNLPIGFQEGFAQYNEMSSSRGHDVATALQATQDAGDSFLSLRDLNDTSTFRRNLDTAYPQSYAVMAFLLDRFGIGPFAYFLQTLHYNIAYEDALYMAYSVPIEELDQQWREYLPQFLKEGWQTNILQANDLSAGIALYDAGRFKEAGEQFARSERLFTDLGRHTEAEEAADRRERAEQAEKASDLATNARQSLEKHDYAAAERYAEQAKQDFIVLDLPRYRDRAQATSQLARQGTDAVALLQAAQSHKQSFNLSMAQREAQQAGDVLAQLGDGPRVAQANAILSDMWLWQRMAGLAVLAVGLLCVIVGALAALRARRRRATSPLPIRQLREENRSWL